ncbi:MAG: 1-acyl-sn-glycerol-3-phosphate acyltransferase, partial [Acidimicrobiia bacterium]
IWKMPVAGAVMSWLRAIPVHKPEEHKGVTKNDQMFGSAYEALGDGTMLLIFPEGITVDDPSIARIKTGAARIALGARAQGTDGIQIVPAGIHYEDKAALRSRVFINIGSPLDLDAELDDYLEEGADSSPENRPLVRGLTDEIEDRLRRVAPDFQDWDQARALTRSAEVSIRAKADDPKQDVSSAQRDRLAGELGRSESSKKQAVIDASNAYDQDLDAVGLTDAQAYDHPTFMAFLWYAIWNIALGVVLLPFALVGIAINWLPLLVVWALGLLPVSPAVKATIKPTSALLLFPLAWALEAWALFGNFDTAPIITIVAILLIPLYLAAALLLSERFVLLWRAWRSWRGGRSVERLGTKLPDGRAQVVAAVSDAIEPASAA